MRDGRQRVSSVLCLAICFLMTASGRSVPQAMLDHGVSLLTFQVARITREPLDQGHRVQLYLTGPGANLCSVYLTYDHREIRRLGQPTNGMIEFQAESDVESIYFTHPGGYQGLHLRLREDSPTEQLLPDIAFSVQEGRELTFARGENAEVHVLATAETNNQTNVRDGSFFGKVAFKSQTEDHVVRVSDRSLIQVVNHTRLEGGRYMHLRLNTSSGDVEGLLALGFYIDFDCGPANACLSSFYFIHEDVPLYREDHQGPFPDNYLGIAKHDYDESWNLTVCPMHARSGCQLYCDVIGDNPSAVEFVRVAGRLAPTYSMAIANGGFRAAGAVVFENVTEPGETEYRCQSRSGSQGVNRTMRVVVVHNAKIINGLTNASRLDDGTVQAECVAEGTPAPTLSLFGRNFTFSSTGGDVTSGPYEVVFTNPNNVTSMATLRISDPDVADHVQFVSCTASNEVLGRNFTDSLRRSLSREGEGNLMPASVRYYLENFVEHPGDDA